MGRTQASRGTSADSLVLAPGPNPFVQRWESLHHHLSDCPHLVQVQRGCRRTWALFIIEPHPGSSKKTGVKRLEFGI